MWIIPYNCVTFADSEPYCHSVLFVCLSGCLSVIPRPTAYHDWSITTKFGWLSSDPCKPFCIPYLPYFRCQREKYAKFRLFPTRRQWVFLPLRIWCIVPCELLLYSTHYRTCIHITANVSIFSKCHRIILVTCRYRPSVIYVKQRQGIFNKNSQNGPE